MAEKHFYEQRKFTQSYLIPYLEEKLPDFRKMKILEVGCAEGGFLDVLQEMGLDGTGIELEQSRVETALAKNPTLKIIAGDITDPGILEKVVPQYDLIVMRDVIEHIPDRGATFENLTRLLGDNGYLYITFPPRFSAFAGHQQNYRSALRFVPYLHLFPAFIIRTFGKLLKENTKTTEQVILNYRVGLTIRNFENHYRRFDFIPLEKKLFLSRPIYKIRFGVKTMGFPNIPLLREVLAFGCEYLLQRQPRQH